MFIFINFLVCIILILFNFFYYQIFTSSLNLYIFIASLNVVNDLGLISRQKSTSMPQSSLAYKICHFTWKNCDKNFQKTLYPPISPVSHKVSRGQLVNVNASNLFKQQTQLFTKVNCIQILDILIMRETNNLSWANSYINARQKSMMTAAKRAWSNDRKATLKRKDKSC